MKEKICTFCGHREVYDDIQSNVNQTILYLIENCGVNTFYSGHRGEFDHICEMGVRKAKKYSHPEIMLYRIEPYLTTSINSEIEIFDQTIVLDSSDIHFKRAITERNRYMVKKSDFVLCYVKRNFGGAYIALKFAEKLGIKIIRF